MRNMSFQRLKNEKIGRNLWLLDPTKKIILIIITRLFWKWFILQQNYKKGEILTDWLYCERENAILSSGFSGFGKTDILGFC